MKLVLFIVLASASALVFATNDPSDSPLSPSLDIDPDTDLKNPQRRALSDEELDEFDDEMVQRQTQRKQKKKHHHKKVTTTTTTTTTAPTRAVTPPKKVTTTTTTTAPTRAVTRPTTRRAPPKKPTTRLTTTTTAPTRAATTPRKTTPRKMTPPRQFTPPNPTEPTPGIDVCLSCADRRNQKDYYANPDNCRTFYHCFFFNETFAVGILQDCPQGTFWNDDVLQCMPEGPTPCFDLCRDDTVAAAGCYGATDNCAEFFQCSHGASAPFCCPPGTRFEQASCSCITDETCTDVCVLPTPIPTAVAPPQTVNSTVCIDSFGVTLGLVPDNPNQFILFETSDPENIVSHIVQCAPGSQFDLAACRCDIELETPILPPGRQCSLWLPFDTDLEDRSIERFLTTAFGNAFLDTTVAAHGTGSLFVDGGRLEIPGLKNYDFQRAASFCLAFRCQNGANGNGFTCSRNAGLFSNNNNASMTDYSIIMSTAATNNFAGRMRFRAPSGSATVTAPINTPNAGWNQACMTYDGASVRLYINGQLVNAETASGGLVAIGHCPYVLGTDQSFGDFAGHIDDVLACPFTMSDDEVEAHFQGNTAFLVSQGLIPAQ